MITYIIHSGDKGAWIWPTWERWFLKYWQAQDFITPLFLGETSTPSTIGIEKMITGPVPYGEGLINALQKIQTRYVILTHEDYFITGLIQWEVLREIEQVMDQNSLSLVKCCGNWSGHISEEYPMQQIDLIVNGQRLWLYNNRSKYTLSHQPSVWNKNFLLSTLQPHWSPWQHELDGSDLIQSRSDVKILSYRGEQPIPYAETVSAGKIREGAERFFEV
jgi:hypothetical protein